jgi:hypothetical protein
MASQLLPLGLPSLATSGNCSDIHIELIDKCVGSKIWVVMKGDKGESPYSSAIAVIDLDPSQNSVALFWASMTMSVSINYAFPCTTEILTKQQIWFLKM